MGIDMLALFRDYMGTGMIVIWYLIALLYLWMKEKRRYMRILFIYMPVVLLVLYARHIDSITDMDHAVRHMIQVLRLRKKRAAVNQAAGNRKRWYCTLTRCLRSWYIKSQGTRYITGF